MRPHLFFGPRGVVCRLTDVFLIDATTLQGRSHSVRGPYSEGAIGGLTIAGHRARPLAH